MVDIDVKAGRQMDLIIARDFFGYREIEFPGQWWTDACKYEELTDTVFFLTPMSHAVVVANSDGHYKFRPSTNITHAWTVVTKLQELGHWVNINTTCDKGLFDVQILMDGMESRSKLVVFTEAPMAICLATLHLLWDDLPLS